MNNPVKTCFAAALLSLSGSLPASSAALSGTGAVRLDDPAMIQRAEELGQRIRAEDGIRTGVQLVEHFEGA